MELTENQLMNLKTTLYSGSMELKEPINMVLELRPNSVLVKKLRIWGTNEPTDTYEINYNKIGFIWQHRLKVLTKSQILDKLETVRKRVEELIQEEHEQNEFTQSDKSYKSKSSKKKYGIMYRKKIKHLNLVLKDISEVIDWNRKNRK
jgi:hypothetical protein